MTQDFQQASQDESSSATAIGPSESANPPSPQSSTLTHRPRTKSDFNKILLEQYLHHNLIHSAAINNDQDKQKAIYTHKYQEAQDYELVKNHKEVFTPSRLYGTGYNGYGNGFTDGPTRILYSTGKRLGKKTPQLRIKRKDMAMQAEQVEELVPIRLDVDWDKVKLRDTFTWNLHERTIKLELFAEQLVEDLGLVAPAAEPVQQQVQQQIHDQLVDFNPLIYFPEDPLDEMLPYTAYKNDEMRILIKLNITIGPHTLEDKFEWDINNPLNSPEEFAQSMTKDLSLSGEFTTAIAHCIREQSQLFIRSLYGVGHPFDGRPVEDADLVAAFLPSPLPSVLRPHQQIKEFAPYLYEMTETDLEKNELVFSREQRRQKRSVNRRGGPILPDLKDRQRTVRTLVVSSVLPGAAATIEESRLYKRVGVPSGRGRRAGFGRQDGADLSESDDSEDSSPESPAIQVSQGTARTRNMRGAATAAQQRMANIGRSETPEALLAHHHETRTSSRKFGRDAREESVDNASLIIKLKMPKEKFKKLVRDLSKSRPNHQQTPSMTRATSTFGTPAPPGSMGPPSTPGVQAAQPLATTPAPAPMPQAVNAVVVGQIGRIDAPAPIPGQALPAPPPPPTWLATGLTALHQQYPNDRFEGMMRYSAVSMATETPVPAPQPGTNAEGIKWMYLPRIRCHDCPGKLYTPGPDTTVGNFEVHLKNKGHREKVNIRLGNSQAPGLSAA
ncbi:SWI/SNF chromatin-remodeling complex subunit [Ciborinia camelliae]|nr:SWI/SNF chromatin-remodeling complex subunit [Ciborinia camelliae]